jgi:hypothetical protein
MKKCLSLFAILGLLLIVTSSFAKAPEFPEVPDVKLFLSEGLTPAFDLAAYNTGDPATSAAISTNPLNLSTLSTTLAADSSIAVANVNYGPYASATSFAFVYALTNDGGTGNANNKVKYADYKINKLPNVGLKVGAYVDINVGNYVQGALYPASFGNNDAVVVSDTTKVSATWQTNSTLRVQLNSAISAPVYVDVIAASVASQPYGMNIDKERISVYGDLLNGGSFATSTDSTDFAYEFGDFTNRASVGWLASKADSANVNANGVMSFTFTGTASGVKATSKVANWLSLDGNTWYTARMRCYSPTASNSFQALLFNYNGIAGTSPTVDISANVLFGIPTTWTWIEAPVYTHWTSTNAGFPQFWFKGEVNGGIVYVDEVQYIKAVPTLWSAKRYDSYNHLARGEFNSYTELTTGWSTEEAYDTDNPIKATPSVSGGVLNMVFATSGTSGMKMTAWNGAGNIYTPSNVANKEVGAQMDVAIASGSFTSINDIVYLGLYGVASNGSADYYSAGGQLIAAAEFGTLIPGTHYVAGNARRGYHQIQIMTKAAHTGTLTFDNYDFLSDKDDPYYGDAVLFP